MKRIDLNSDFLRRRKAQNVTLYKAGELFGKDQIKTLRDIALNDKERILQLPVGNGVFVNYKLLSKYSELFHKFDEVVTGSDRFSFIRYNGPNVDTKRSIHTDADIFGKKYTNAAVTLLHAEELTGVMFYEPTPMYLRLHPEIPSVITEDDHLWNSVKMVQLNVPGDTVVYSTDAYHSRFPFACKEDRYVLVTFFNATREA